MMHTVFAVVALWLLACAAVAQDASLETVGIRGYVTATDEEVEMCTFAIGSDLTIIARPKSDLCALLRARRDTWVRLTIGPE